MIVINPIHYIADFTRNYVTDNNIETAITVVGGGGVVLLAAGASTSTDVLFYAGATGIISATGMIVGKYAINRIRGR